MPQKIAETGYRYIYVCRFKGGKKTWGFQVRKDGFTSKFFHYRKHGGKDKALRKAVKWRRFNIY